MTAILRNDMDGVLRVQMTGDPAGPVLALDEISQGPRWAISIINAAGQTEWIDESPALPAALRLFAGALDKAGVE